MKINKYFVVFNVPIALGNGDNGFNVRAVNVRHAIRIAKRKCLKAYSPKYISTEKV